MYLYKSINISFIDTMTDVCIYRRIESENDDGRLLHSLKILPKNEPFKLVIVILTVNSDTFPTRFSVLTPYTFVNTSMEGYYSSHEYS